MIIPELRGLVLTKRHVGSGNEIVKYTYRFLVVCTAPKITKLKCRQLVIYIYFVYLKRDTYISGVQAGYSKSIRCAKIDTKMLKGRGTRCNKSWGHAAETSLSIAAPSHLVCTAAAACAYSVTAICRMNSNQIEFMRQIAATVIFICHMRRFVAVNCRGGVLQRFVASCVLA